jgi:ribosomal protein S18 acetylase RimI-like enzyme
MVRYRLAEVNELDDLKSFLFEHATNPWNHLPAVGVDNEFSLVAQQQASALVAEEGNQTVGFVIFYHPTMLPSKYHQYTNGNSAVYIAEAVVHRNYGSQGIGTRLLTLVIERAPSLGASMLIVDRHEQNAASAGMMRKAGFIELCTFVDEPRRNYGSKKTTILGMTLGAMS